jgi:hypothetical protein
MSSALAMVLTAAMVVPGNGPEMVSAEMEQRLDLRGEWEGTWHYSVEGTRRVVITGNRLFFITGACAVGRPFVCVQESAGTFRAHWDGEACLGIYRYDGGRLLLCVREASKGYPTSFRAGAVQDLLILHRVQPRK